MGSSPPVRPWKLQLKLESWGNGKGYFQQHFHISAAETDAIWKQLCSSVTQFKICSFSPQRLSNNRDMRIILWVINAGAACSICLAFSRKAQQQDAFVETPTSDFRNTQASGVDTNSSDLQSYGSPNPPALKWSLVKSTKSPSPSQLNLDVAAHGRQDAGAILRSSDRSNKHLAGTTNPLNGAGAMSFPKENPPTDNGVGSSQPNLWIDVNLAKSFRRILSLWCKQ